MALSKFQIAKFWKEWSLAKAQLQSSGYSSIEAEEWRQQTTATALGTTLEKRKKPAQMTSRDMDIMLQHFRAVSAPDDFDGQIELQQAERTRLIYGIRQDSKGDAWLIAVCRDIYGHERWDDLPMPDLLKFRRRVANAARSQRMKEAIAQIAK